MSLSLDFRPQLDPWWSCVALINILLTSQILSDTSTTYAIGKGREWNHKTKLTTDTLKETVGGLILTSGDIYCYVEATALAGCGTTEACVTCLQAITIGLYYNTVDTECAAFQNCEDSECNACSQELANYIDCLLVLDYSFGCGSSQGSNSVSWIYISLFILKAGLG